MSDKVSVSPAVQTPPGPHQEKETGPDGGKPVSAALNSVWELPEGWEPLPLDPNCKNPDYQTYRYRGVTMASTHLLFGYVQQIALFRGRPSDVIVASFPKSGTTWLQEVVWRVVHGETGPESGGGATIEYRFPILEACSVPGIMEMAPLHTMPGPRLIKSHIPHHMLPKSVWTSGAKVLYVSRDPRDTCVSMYHFCRMVDVQRYRGTFAEFRDSFARGEVCYGPYREHVRRFQEHSDTVLCVTYEQLHQDRAGVVRRVATFLDRPLTEEQVQAIVRYSSFQAMKENPATNFRQWEKNGQAARDEGTFMRKGVTEDWRNYFTQEESDAFMSQLL